MGFNVYTEITGVEKDRFLVQAAKKVLTKDERNQALAAELWLK
jgi:hypothetical protein